MTKARLSKRITSLLLSVILLMTCIPLSAAAETTGTGSGGAVQETSTVVDPGTAYAWETMMGTEADGNRYAGRVWVDKSVYKNGDTAVLNSKGESGSSFKVELEDDEAFQVVFSALGSTMTSKSTTTTTGPLDVVLILDNSSSMNTTAGGTTRMQKVIESANQLLDDLLSGHDVRLGITAYGQNASIVLPFDTYQNGVELRVNRYTGSTSSSGVITAYDNANQLINRNYKSDGYANYTNTQAGFDLGMEMLENATNTTGRKPVVILLTDGAANTALDTLFDRDKAGTVRQVYHQSDIDPMIALSTLLSAAYNKATVEDRYGRSPMVYGIGVDLSSKDGSNAIIDPKKNFNAENSNNNIKTAYRTYTTTWLADKDVSVKSGGYSFNFGHEYPQGSAVADADIAANINYVDTYYSVAGADLQGVFEQIYQELSSAAFNPISSSSTVNGATGVDNTPLIYVDFIGQHMEIKEIQAITLFGASYNVLKDADGKYMVKSATGINPTTNEAWNTAEDIKISVTEQADKTQKLEIKINQEILPIIMEKIDSKTVGEVTTSTITEYAQAPLRVYYTVGIDSDILLPNGDIDVSKIRGYQYIDDVNGTVSFYSNQFGVINSGNSSQEAIRRDAHVGFKPSKENRFYYHQANQGIFTKITDENGNEVEIPANNEYGIVWNDESYNLTWMSYAEYLDAMDPDNGDLNDDSKVYTYVTYYRPTTGTGDAPNVAEEVTYLVCTNWKYLKDSIAFYDANTETYLNNGKAIAVNEAISTVNAYKSSNPEAKIYAILGVGSRRTSRLHNMMVNKTSNVTNTASESYKPEYLEQKSAHYDNDVAVWLGNNGKITVPIDTGIALTKNVTEAIGNADDTYALTVTVPTNVTETPVVKDANGNNVTFEYKNNVLTVNVKAGGTVYVSGIPGGTVCEIGEIINGDYYKVDAQSTVSVTVPTLSQVLAATNPVAQFVPATVTNAPNKYGDLTISKDISHDLTNIPAAMAGKVFTFKVQLSDTLAGKKYQVDATNASQFSGTEVTVGSDGSFVVSLKDNESITIMDLPEKTAYTVTETSVAAGYTNSTGTVSGEVSADGDHVAHFVNTYGYTPIAPSITITGKKTVEDVNDTYSNMTGDVFKFVLSQYTAGGYVILAETTAVAGENYSFQLNKPLDIGDHNFRVEEVSGSIPGMTYDATSGLFVVKVTDTDADGTLEYVVENRANTTVDGNTVTKNFTNVYNVNRTYVDINVEKQLDNNTGVNLPLNLFSFEVVNTAKPEHDPAIDPQTVTTDASGKATIRLANLGEGVYKYTLTEKNGGMAGMTYDTVPRDITVEVTNDNGVLKAVARIGNEPFNSDVSGGDVSGGDVSGGDANINTNTNAITVVFTNKYELDGIAYTINGTKKLEGRTINSGEFTFELYETDSSFAIPEGVAPNYTTSNNGEGFSFAQIEYNQVGTYYYSVKEKTGNLPGVTYDTTHYHVTVTVDVNQNGTGLVANAVINKIGHNSDESGNMVFVNTYVAQPTVYALAGNKVLRGRALRAGEFTFELHDEEGLIETVTNKADGSFAFKEIPYTKAGDYTYTIKEVEGTVPGIKYDGVETPIAVTVTVRDDVEKGELIASANVSNTAIKFENTYKAAPAQVSFNGTKELKGGTLVDDTFTFNLYKTDNSFDIAADTAELLDTTKNVDGAFAFTEVLNTTGTYFFVIAEDATVDTITDVVYDSTQHKFMVIVNDIGDGQLKAVVTNMETGMSSESAASVTADISFTNATFDEVTEKEVYLEDSADTQIDGQKVNAGDILTYFITYKNYTGKDVVVDIMDTIPEHTTYVEGSASGNGTYAGTHVNWILNVPKGEGVTVSFDVKVNDTQAIVANEAVVRDGINTYITNEVVNHTVEKEFVKDVFSSADTTVSIDGKKVYEGDELLYKINYTNITSDVADIKITDMIPANTTYVTGSADNGGVYGDGAIVWNIKDVSAWATVTVTFKVTVNSGIGAVTIKNQANATDGTNNYVTEWVSNHTIKDEVEKKVYKADDNQVNIDCKQVYAGDELIYTITYKNTSGETAAVTITDTIPQHTTYVDGSADNGGTYNNGVVTWTKDVAANAAITVSFKVKVNVGVGETTISNKAIITEGKNTYTTNEVLNYTFEEKSDTNTDTTDEPTPPTNPPVIPATPATGDDTNLWLWFALLFICGGVLVGTVIYGKKKKVIEK